MRAPASTVPRSAGRHGLRAVLALLAALSLAASAHAQTAAGTVVTNVASAAFVGSDGTARTTPSNPVQSDVTAVCGLRITPDGTLASPGHAVVARPGETISLPYLFTSAANVSADFELEALLDPASALAPVSIAIHLDLNGDGVLDPGEPAVTELVAVGSGATVPLILVVTLADDDSVAGDVFIDLVGRCAGDPSVVDDGNVARISVSRDGVRDLVKAAVPAPGGALAPGAAVTYTVGFTVNEVALTGVVLRDELDPLLQAPTALAVAVDGVSQPGLATFEPGTRTVSVPFSELLPGTRVDLTVTARVRADAAAGLVLRNRADLEFDGGTVVSNVVEHTILAVCRVSITPDGSVAAPGQTVTVLAGRTAVLAYDLWNTGNAAADFVLSVASLGASTVAPLDVRIVRDLDGDGEPGPDEPVVARLDALPVGARVPLLVIVALPPDAAAGGRVYVDLVGACAGDPAAVDDGNVGLVMVAPIGFEGPTKSATPPSGEAVYPGAPLRYEIDFIAGPVALRDVEVRDTLDPQLEAPPSFVSEGTIVDPDSGLSAFATASFVDGTITWRLAEVPAGMTVRLAFETTVRRDAPIGGTIINRAVVDGGDSGSRGSNATDHPIDALDLGLTKSADPEQARPGERLTYLLVASNPSAVVRLPEVELVDTLPDGVVYLPGTARLTLADGATEALEPDVDGGVLRWLLPPLAPGERHELRFEVRLLPLLQAGASLVNRAELRAIGGDGEVITAVASAVATLVAPGALGGRSVLLGTAYVDHDRDGRFDREIDTPLPGLRLYLPDGRSTVTDVDGRYAFLDLAPGMTSLKLDATTMPPRWLDRTPTAAADGLWRVTLQPGAMTRQDLPFAPPEAELAARQRLTVAMGPLTLVKSWAAADGVVTVTLELVSGEPLRGLMVVDALPAGASLLAAPLRSDGTPLVADGLAFDLGDLAAGATIEVRYAFAPAGADAPLPLTPPRIRWELRP